MPRYDMAMVGRDMDFRHKRGSIGYDMAQDISYFEVSGYHSSLMEYVSRSKSFEICATYNIWMLDKVYGYSYDRSYLGWELPW